MKTQLTKLNRITARITKGTTPTTMGFDFIDYGVNYIKAEALNGDSELDMQSFSHISDDAHNKLKRSILQNNDVLVTIAGVNIGKVGIVKQKHLPANTNQAVGIVRVKSDLVNSSYIYYWFKNPLTFDYLQSINSQAAQPNINLEMLGNLSILLPDIQNQQKIALTITAYDDLINTNRRRIQLLEESARLLFREWFVYFRFPGNEKVKIVDDVPEGWEKVPFPELVDFKEGPGLRNHQFRDEGIPFLNIRTFGDDEIDFSKVGYLYETEVYEKYKHFLLKEDDHVISSSGTLGRLVTIRASHLPLMLNTSLIRMRPKEPMKKWILKAYLLNGGFIEKATSLAIGAAQLNFGPAHLNKMKILLPKNGIIDEFEKHVSMIYLAKKNLLEQNHKLAQVRDLLLPRLMSGAIEA